MANTNNNVSTTRFKTTHGMSHTAVYNVWLTMIARTKNPNGKFYYRYGGRGITVHPRWLDFANFYADMGPRPDKCSIERIDNDGNYEPGNCRWATQQEQTNNTRRNVWLTHDGQTLTVAQWARKIGIQVNTLYRRLRYWPADKALTTPLIYSSSKRRRVIPQQNQESPR